MRAKFYCDLVEDQKTKDGEKYAEEVTLSAVCLEEDDKVEENKRFNAATPWADMKMGIDNPGAFGFFKPGKCYYLDFSEA